MKANEGIELDRLAAMPQTAGDRMLDYSMRFVFAVEDKLDELGMSRRQLAWRLGCSEDDVDMVLGGDAEITLGTIAAYDAALGMELRFIGR